MGGQLDGNFLPGSLPHKISLIVTLIICSVVNNFCSLSLSLIAATYCAAVPPINAHTMILTALKLRPRK